MARMFNYIFTLVIFGFYLAFSLAEHENNGIEALVRGAESVSSAYFVAYQFHYLNTNPVATSSVTSFLQCSVACLGVVTCFSFNVAAKPDGEGRTLCELLSSDKYNSSDKFKANPVFHHYSIYTPCSKDPCENGGKCVALYSLGDFKCICSPCSHGKRCETAFPVNLALNKPASQSSTYYHGHHVAGKAVDGNTDTDINPGSHCTHTNTESSPWWRVDLGSEEKVAEVKIWNRGDCCGDRLNGFQIVVANTTENSSSDTICGENLYIPQGQSKSFRCSPAEKGRFVKIRIPGPSKILSVCEVQVFGAVCSH